jgi:hypothetical protein
MISKALIASALHYASIGCLVGGIIWLACVFLYWLEFYFPWNKEGRAMVISHVEKAQRKAKENPGVVSFVWLILELLCSMPTLRPIASILIGVLFFLLAILFGVALNKFT